MKRTMIFALALFLIAGFVSAGGAAEKKEVVKIAYVPVMHFAPIYVAAERGYFAEEGIDAQFTRVKSGTACMAFLAEGKVSVGAIAVVASAWNAFHKGMDIRIVASAGLKQEKDDPTMLVVRKDLWDSGQVKGAGDLKGLRVAMAGGPGGGGEYLVSKALEQGGLTIRDVKMSKIGNPDMKAALQSKAIDAALTGSPYAYDIIKAEYAVPLSKDMTPGAMTVVFVYSGQFIKERPEVAKKFMVALMKGARALQGDKFLDPKNMAAYMKYQKASEESIRKGLPMLYDPNLEIKMQSLDDIERTHMKNGRLTYSTPLEKSNVVDTTFQQYSVSVLGGAEMIPPVTEATK
jgi:NitT/TauT family transport system substrate-binding protein